MEMLPKSLLWEKPQTKKYNWVAYDQPPILVRSLTQTDHLVKMMVSSWKRDSFEIAFQMVIFSSTVQKCIFKSL